MTPSPSASAATPAAHPTARTTAHPPAPPRWAGLLLAVLLLAALLVPFQSLVYPVFVMKVLCFALFACAFNLLFGFAGLLSFGHAAFFGWAGYVTAYLCQSQGVGPGLGLLAGVLTGGVIGLVIGAIAIRRDGIYFAMITLALSQLLYFLAVQAPFTNGEDGIQNVPRGLLFGVVNLRDDTAMYYLVLALFAGGLAVVHRVVNSPFGEVLTAIRENEPRAISLGYRVRRYKLIAFVISAALAGLAGATKALVFQVATLADVHWHTSGEVVLMTLLGGLGTFAGPVIGAAVVVSLHSYLAAVGAWSTVVIGLVFMACVLTFRRGVVGEWLAMQRKRFNA